ncbi:MAG TPA: ferritin family protein [Thermococcaceae archaeon]|uniref:Rubrerythrin-related protein n=2 Tax=Thermococcus sibiricus TaxID=172049 RepID=C5ZZW6_THESM|nr:ferritin family protein [Thermococcus sibiricus]ACS90947.1 rubrerythrin-related protein [Thermococcus sibiricus MM 739]KUK18525.1 MAG: Rubrerythrin-related protein [Thermococcus sibiricus]KUK29166.1 MAG: Rubrerythrin-related protein [Thermococcus sp. 40_45]HII66985.1 ferritin family protein [Thermococcaceae archaeon]
MEEDIVIRLETLSEKEILGYAIASEEDAKAFYLKLGEGKGELIQNFFKDLAKAEEAHKTLLLNLHKKLFGNENYITPKGIPFLESTINVVTLGSMVEAMKTALMNEKVAERVYKLLAKRFPEHKALFEFLATQERAHYNSIKAHEEYLEGIIREKPDYVDVPVHVLFNQLEIHYKPRVL